MSYKLPLTSSDGSYSMKPNTTTAIYELISQVRTSLPFDLSEEELCSDHCLFCKKKLLEFLEMDITEWEGRLAQNEVPSLGEVKKFATRCRKIHKAFTRNKG